MRPASIDERPALPVDDEETWPLLPVDELLLLLLLLLLLQQLLLLPLVVAFDV